MKDDILFLLTSSNMWTHQVAARLELPEGEVLIALAELTRDGRARRLLDAKWALSMSEHNRRRRHGNTTKTERYRGIPGSLPTVRRDPSPFPRPRWKTPNVGFFW